MFWGEVNEYDQSWKDYAVRNPNVDIIFMKFEDFINDKPSHIKKLAEFIGFKNPNIDDIMKNSTLEATIERRKTKWENEGCKFWEIVCYRKGKTGSWNQKYRNTNLDLQTSHFYRTLDCHC